MTIYYVMSQRQSQKQDEEEAIPSAETRRTDRRSAEQDANIIKTIFGRKSWIEEKEKSNGF
jgi:hypothetical protein